MGFVLGNGIHAIDHTLWSTDSGRKRQPIDFSISGLWRDLAHDSSRFTGSVTDQEGARAILRGALALYGFDQHQASNRLVSLLASQELFDKSLCEIVAEHFGLSSYQLPN